MNVHRENDGTYVVSLMRGDLLRESIEGLAVRENIVAAQLSAIGAVEDPELGCYLLEKKEYLRRTFPGILELVSLQGNLTLKDGRPFLHAHIAVSGEDFVVFGGHLFEAKAGVVVELFIRPLSTPLPRILCEEIGLARWEPGGTEPKT